MCLISIDLKIRPPTAVVGERLSEIYVDKWDS